ncbi:choice-of-anchor B family protein [Alteromonas ponticola]|uniref:Choice-of-anchor B family protein n=1 Tax=Alteromonas aquimaris TaxID=2998417 RepID=A0ABT3P2D6_9ALTE|nr:choice-of-anchor B family protein [Alteromonas aquimaris]MCW8106923.1 choice-of-anchor B family protein [Alteromonas aquimaris]
MHLFSLISSLPGLIVLLSLTISQAVQAHSEGDKYRFVANDGKDTGACENRFRPCETIAYATSQANKGDQILVSAGHYPVHDEHTLFHLINELVPVFGGYSRTDHYQIQNPSRYDTVLSGVPLEFAKQLSAKGFNVIADGKQNITTAVLKQVEQSVTQLTTRHSTAECVDGMAAGFTCQNISLLAHLPLAELPTDSASANDIWGHVDLNTMREYALIGLRRGVAVVDVSDPASPQIVGSISGAATTWRDIKVYQYFNRPTHSWRAFAYISADSASENLRILDLNQLPHRVDEVDALTDDVRAHNIYITHTDPGLNISLPGSTSELIVAGAENFFGAWRSYRLSTPSKPTAAYRNEIASRTDYSHDVSGFFVTDERAREDCKGSSSISCSVILDFNEESVRLWDTSNPQIPWQIGETTYPNLAYTHSGWPSEDNQYLFVHDEMDESSLSLNTAVYVFDISDLTVPNLVTTWEGDTRAIDHNGYAKGNRYYFSNYERGLTVLDISDPTSPAEIGSFDTFPSSDNAAFNGAWGVYPFLPSDIVLVSDIQGGLYIFRDDTSVDAPTTVGFTETEITVQPGETVQLPVQRQGAANINVDYRIIYGSANNTDFTASDGTLNWNAADDPNQNIEIDINENEDDEFTETFFIRLINPSTGNVKNGSGLLAVHIKSERGNQGVANFTSDRFEVAETVALYNLNVARVGGVQGALRVTFEVTAGTASSEDFQPQSGELAWEDGDNQDKIISLILYDDEIEEETETLTVTLTGTDENAVGDIATTTVSIRDNESNQPPQVNAGADQTVSAGAQVELNASASDPENDRLTYTWRQSEGETVTLAQADSLTPSFTAPQTATTLVITLTVTDELGASASDNVSISVIADNGSGTGNEGLDSNTGSGGGGSLGQWWLLFLTFTLLLKTNKNKAPSTHF